MGDLLAPLTSNDQEAPAGALPTAARDNESNAHDGRFDWINEDSIVVHEQRAVAVYRNRANGIVIRQEDPDGEDHDAFVVLRDADAAKALVDALQREIGGRAR